MVFATCKIKHFVTFFFLLNMKQNLSGMVVYYGNIRFTLLEITGRYVSLLLECL